MTILNKKIQILIHSLLSICIISCGTTQRVLDLSSLSREQIQTNKEAQGESGKCYTKMKASDGIIAWYESICVDKYNGIVQKGLKKLGYPIDENEIKRKLLGPTSSKALQQFQKEAGLAFGALDEATIYHILSKSKLSE